MFATPLYDDWNVVEDRIGENAGVVADRYRRSKHFVEVRPVYSAGEMVILTVARAC